MTQFARATTLLVALGALAAPLAAHAQSDTAPVTRAQVHDDLVRIEQAGYDPHKVSVHYPADIQAAQAKLQSQASGGADSGYGTPSDGSVASGIRTPADAQQKLFSHH
ncbi:hypothetical protein GCM10027093_26090 [Paraburkholderia jirisanensis]